jgi:hypothetical protein
MTHSERIERFMSQIEEAMRGLEGWMHPLEIQTAMQPVYASWSLLHSLTISAYHEAKLVDDGLQSIAVPKEQTVAASLYAKRRQQEERS